MAEAPCKSRVVHELRAVFARWAAIARPVFRVGTDVSYILAPGRCAKRNVLPDLGLGLVRRPWVKAGSGTVGTPLRSSDRPWVLALASCTQPHKVLCLELPDSFGHAFGVIRQGRRVKLETLRSVGHVRVTLLAKDLV